MIYEIYVPNCPEETSNNKTSSEVVDDSGEKKKSLKLLLSLFFVRKEDSSKGNTAFCQNKSDLARLYCSACYTESSKLVTASQNCLVSLLCSVLSFGRLRFQSRGCTRVRFCTLPSLSHCNCKGDLPNEKCYLLQGSHQLRTATDHTHFLY